MRQLRLLGLFLLLMPLLFVQSASAADEDTYDDTPDVVARVSRISFIRGEVQIRRSGSDEWEKAALNLPLVEGDQIVTAAGARVEFQLDTYNYVRLAENSFLTFNTLRDDQVALSLPEGTVSVRVLSFDASRSSFEIDAPQTTLAVQRAGMYRIDAGEKTSEVIHITVTEGGQARIYSDNSGFLLKNGRTATLYLSGDNAGQPEIDSVAKYTDEWDTWVLERDSIVAKKLRDSYYDKYYDRDVYGAEDLNDYGEWVYTRSYGYVWRPYRTATVSYDNWSPYRYGSWRWVPPYGWIWLGDEPWGWATYHHGRWVYYAGNWCWTPYGQHRWRRNWWQPALVVITWSGSSICWYPLPYNYYYYNYNSYYYSNHWGYYGGHHGWNGHHGGGHNPGGGPGGGTGGGSGGGAGGGGAGTLIVPPPKGPKKPPLQPPGAVDPAYTQAVSTTGSDGFVKGRGGIKQAPLALAVKATTRQTLAEPVKLPVFTDTRNAGSDVKPNQQIQVAVRNGKDDSGANGGVKIGAAVREPGVKLDDSLRKDRVLGGRPPLEKPQTNSGGGDPGGTGGGKGGVRATGAVVRDEPPVKSSSGGGDVQSPRVPATPRNDTKPQYEPPPPQEKPRYEPPPQEKPRYEPPPPQEKPRYDPPPPPQEKPRYDPPPRNDPPPRSDPPPKQEPRSEPKSEPTRRSDPPPSENKKPKDG